MHLAPRLLATCVCVSLTILMQAAPACALRPSLRRPDSFYEEAVGNLFSHTGTGFGTPEASDPGIARLSLSQLRLLLKKEAKDERDGLRGPEARPYVSEEVHSDSEDTVGWR